MFSRIKKSKVYKGCLIAVPVIAGIMLVLWFLWLGRVMLEIGWGAWMRQSEYVHIDRVFRAADNDDIDVQTTTITFVGYNEDEINIEAEMTCIADVRNEVRLRCRQGYFVIHNAYVDDEEINIDTNNEINLDDDEFVISKTGTHEFKFLITYKSYLDVYEDYKAMKVENTIKNSTLVLSDKFKVEQQDDLLKKDKEFKVYDAESTFEFTNELERLVIYKIAKIYSIIAFTYIGIMFVFSTAVEIGYKREKKRAVESAPQENT